MNPFEFMGKSDFVWFMGVVEDIQDPLQLGRCRVRCYGLHNESKEDIPTDSLPWAHPIQPITSAGVSGVGTTPTGILPGSQVVGFFRDGRLCQQPILLGTIGGFNKEQPDPTIGFSDPAGVYPSIDYIGHPDTNKLALGDSLETIVTAKIVSAETNSKHKTPESSTHDKEWSEPVTPYAAVYPYNHVKESQSGHIEEVDDTPGAERMHRYHTSGTFEEIHPDGKKVVKVISDNYDLIAGSDFIHVVGNVNVMVGPLQGEANSRQGNVSVYVVGNTDIEIEGNMNAVVHKNSTIRANEKAVIHGEQGVHVYSNNGISLNDDERFKLYTKDGNTIITTEKDFNIKAEGNVIIQGKFVDLNP